MKFLDRAIANTSNPVLRGLLRTANCLFCLLQGVLGVVCLPFGLVLLVLLAAPVLYFYLRFFTRDELKQKYEDESYKVSACVVERRRNSTSDGTSYHVKVCYQADEEKEYTKEFPVSFGKYHNNSIEVELLPGFSQSAVICGNRSNETDMYFWTGSKYFAIFGSLFWTASWYFGALYANLREILDPGIALTITISSVVGFWIIGYFAARYLRDRDLFFTLYGAEPVIPPENVEIPRVSYDAMFPSSAPRYPPLAVLQLLVRDTFDLVTCIVILAYMLLFGASFYLFQLVIVNRYGRYELMEEYATRGQMTQGSIVDRRYPPNPKRRENSKIQVQYSPFPGNSEVFERTFSTFQQYGNVCCCCRERGQIGRFVSLPYPESTDSLDMYILPNKPRSARPAIEVENRGSIYRLPTWGLVFHEFVITVLILAVQSFLCAILLVSLRHSSNWYFYFVMHLMVSLFVSFAVQLIRRRRYIQDSIDGANPVEIAAVRNAFDFPDSDKIPTRIERCQGGYSD